MYKKLIQTVSLALVFMGGSFLTPCFSTHTPAICKDICNSAGESAYMVCAKETKKCTEDFKDDVYKACLGACREWFGEGEKKAEE